MRLLVEATALALRGTGIREYIVNLLDALVRLDPSIEVRLNFTGSRDDLASLERDLPYPCGDTSLVLPRPLVPHRDKLAFLLGGLCARQGDVYWGPNYFLPLVSCGKRRLLTVHDLSYLLFPHFYPVKGGLFRWKLADSLQRAHSVLVVSRSAGEDLCSLFKVPDERVKVVSNTLSGSFLREVSAEQIAQVKERCGIRGPYMISVGTLQPRKNFAGLIEAFSLLEGALPDDFHLVIMGGEGWMYDDVLAARERSPLKERIVLTGWIPGEDRPALYRGALALVLPSFYEGFGIPIIEAFASHIPVACSNVSSLPEVAGDAALLFDPRRCEDIADAVSALIEDGTLREELVRRGSKRLAAFHPDAVGKELHRILEEQK